jgi:cytosine/adenosine deaminase-related metal-dependent hydrolase
MRAPDSPPRPAKPPALVLHRARWVLPILTAPIADGAVLVEGTGEAATVRAVGSVADLAGMGGPGVRELDHGEGVLLPGLVNAHTHLELSALRDLSRLGVSYGDWLREVRTALAALTADAAAPAIASGVAECIAAGTALVGDVSDRGWSVRPLVRSPLAGRVFHEVVGFDPRQAEPVLAEVRGRLAAAESASSEAFRHSLAPHAPYSVSMRLLRLIRGVNAQDGRPTAIHLAESAAEDEFFATGEGPIQRLKAELGTTVSGWEPPGEPSVQYLARIGWFEGRQIAAHGTQLSARGIEILRRAPGPVTVCLCPRSNRTLDVGKAPARALAAAGVPLALGTDSLASAPSLSLFDELAAAAADYGLEPESLLHAATLGGATALGFGAEHGAIAPGRAARLIALAAPRGTRIGQDPYALLFGEPGPDQVTWISGPAAESTLAPAPGPFPEAASASGSGGRR